MTRPATPTTPPSARPARSRARGLTTLALGLTVIGCAEAGRPLAPGAAGASARAGVDGSRGEPALFAPGVISLPATEEWRVTFTPDGDTAYFARSAQFFPFSRQATILRSHRAGDGWSTPEVAEFSGTYADIDPFITSDGRRLFFSSIRPVDGQPRRDVDVWVVERTAAGTWGEPVNLGAAVNTPSDELYPSVDDDGTLYVGTDRPGGLGGFDIWRNRLADDGRSRGGRSRHGHAAGAYAPAENLGPAVNTALWEFNPAISPDGRRLAFTGLNRPGGYGLGDLYVSYQHRGAWTPAANVGPPVNTALDEYHPSFDPKGKTLYFVRHSYAPWVPGDLYMVRVSALGNRLRPGGSLRGGR